MSSSRTRPLALAAGLFMLIVLFHGHLPVRAAAMPAPPPQGEAARGLSSAMALMDAGHYGEAADFCLDLLRRHPEIPEVDLLLARASSLAGRLTHAFLAYERLVSGYPDDADLRLEFAALLTRMGNSEAAKAEMESARRLRPDLVSERDIRLTVTAMQDRDATFVMHGRVAAGGLYDSNLNTAPSLRNVRLGDIPIELDSRSTAKDSFGGYLQAVSDFSWRPSSDSSLWVVSDIAGYQRWSSRSSYRRDLTFGRGALGLRFLENELMLDIRGKAETVLENNDTALNIFGADAMAGYALRPRSHVLARGAVEYREDIVTEGREGVYWWGGGYFRQFFGEDGHSVMAGLKAYGSETLRDRFSYQGLEPNLTLFLNLPGANEVVAGVAWHRETYRGPATIFERGDREDEQLRLSAFLIHRLTDNWRIEAGWQYTDNISNSDLYTYDQHLVMLGLAWEF